MPVNNCGNWQICSTQSSKKQNAIISLHIDDDAYRWKSVSPSKLGFFSFWPNIYTDIILNFTFSFSLSFSVSRFLFIFVLKLSISTFIHHPNLYLDDTLFSKIYASFFIYFFHMKVPIVTLFSFLFYFLSNKTFYNSEISCNGLGGPVKISFCSILSSRSLILSTLLKLHQKS